MKKEQIMKIASEIAQSEKVPKELIDAIIATESNFEHKAETPFARGLMMLSEVALEDLKLPFKYSDMFDPEKNITAGTRYFKKLYHYWARQLARWKVPDEIFDALVFIFSVLSYNWGVGNVKRWLTQTPADNACIDEKVPHQTEDHFFDVVWWAVYFSRNLKEV